MPSPAMTVAAPTEGGTAQTTQSAEGGAPAPVVPFVRASAEHIELISDQSLAQTTADQNLTTQSIPAYGYLRAIIVQVECSGGAAGLNNAVYKENGPWSAIKNIALTEPNGAIIAQFNSGFDLYLAHKYGGYRGFSDPRDMGDFVTPTSGNFKFTLRIPVELNGRDALGSLPNQNSAAMFQVRAQIGAAADVFSTIPDTKPTIRVRLWAEEWDQPALSSGGAANQTTPPAMNSTQFWTPQRYAVNSGLNTIRLTRVGNYIRNLIFYLERSAGTRANGEADWPETVTMFLDARPLTALQEDVWRSLMYERYGYGFANADTLDGTGTQDNGVYVLDFMHEFDGKCGYENRDLWLPTLGSTRLELQGTFDNAGTLTVLTNDVTVAGNVFM